MKIVLRKRTSIKENSRLIKRARVRKKVFGDSDRLRVSLFKSLRGLYLQLIDDSKGNTVLALSSKHLNKKANLEGAKVLGLEFGKRILAKGLKKVVFDRSGYAYHGKVKAVADGIREAGVII